MQTPVLFLLVSLKYKKIYIQRKQTQTINEVIGNRKKKNIL